MFKFDPSKVQSSKIVEKREVIKYERTRTVKKKKKREVVDHDVTPRKRSIRNVNRDREPGINTPTANYGSVAIICSVCNDIYTHFKNSEKQKLMCSNCGKITKFGGGT